MVRRGRSAPAPAPARSHVPAKQAPPPPPPAPVQAAPQQPSMFSQMAATAGGVAVGSAIGHTVGHAMTGMFSGGGSQPEVQQQQPQQPTYSSPVNTTGPNEPQGPCAWEIKQFLQCAQQQTDITLCEGFNEALRQCKAAHGVKKGPE